jgi:hypothetical protein
MSESHAKTEVMDLTRICSTFPETPEPEVSRENLITLLEGLLKSNKEIIVVEGEEGIGKTTLLAQFACAHPQEAICAFLSDSSQYASDPVIVAGNLHEQIQFALGNVKFKKRTTSDTQGLLRASIVELQRKASEERKNYFFIIDGLDELPDEDHEAVIEIFDLLPIGLSTFRFLLSGSVEKLEKLKRGKITLKPWVIPVFSADEIKKYFNGIEIEREYFETIKKVSHKGVPGWLASIRRQCVRPGMVPNQVLSNLSEHMPDLLEKEWSSVGKAPEPMRLALAILCFDKQPHNIDSLCSAVGVNNTELKAFLDKCTFINWSGPNEATPSFAAYFRRFATAKLVKMRKLVFTRGIELMMAKPDSREALNNLPYYYSESEQYSKLLDYLSGDHIGKMIDCTESWGPLDQKVELGLITAHQLNRGADLMRFGLQRSAVRSVESCEQRRSEIEAYVAMGDFTAASSLAQTARAREDRLHMLAIIASSKRKKGLPIETELKEQVRQLYSQIDKKSLGDRAVEIALDLIYCQPELAIDLIQESQDDSVSKDSTDMAFANLSVRTMVGQTKDKDSGEACAQLNAKIHSPAVQKFIQTVSALWGGWSATDVITMLDMWEKPSDRIYVMRIWASQNRRKPDAGQIIAHAIETIIKTTEYSPNAKVYRELAMPLPFLPDNDVAKALVNKFDIVKSLIQAAGPTEEYVWLQLLISAAEYKYAKDLATTRFSDIYLLISELNDLTTKTACLARLSSMLKRTDPYKEMEPNTGIHKTSAEDLEAALRKLLNETADHYEAVQPALRALAASAPERALDFANSLNTEPRRDRARIEILKTLLDGEPKAIKPEFIDKILAAIYYATNKDRALLALPTHLAAKCELVSHLLPALKRWEVASRLLACPADRCKFLLSYHKICNAQKPDPDKAYITFLHSELKKAWSQVDGNCSQIDLGFHIIAEIGNSSPSLVQDIISEIKQIRTTEVLDNQTVANTYIASCRLTIRAFSGLIKKELQEKDDLHILERLIAKVPSARIRAIMWAEVALRADVEGDNALCKDIVKIHVKGAIGEIRVEDKDDRIKAIVATSAALFRGHAGTAEELIDALPEEDKDGAYREICSFLLLQEIPNEPYSNDNKNKKQISNENISDICRLINKMKSDGMAFALIEGLIENVGSKQYWNTLTREQKSDAVSKLKSLFKLFPSQRFIQHDGYKILASAEIGHLDKIGTGDWDLLINQAKALPNKSDKALVLSHLAKVMARSSKLASRAKQTFEDAKLEIEGLSSIRERLFRYESLAKDALEFDIKISKAVLQAAIQSSIALEAEDVNTTRRRLVDLAYRIQPDFAEKLASELDDDPARTAKRIEIKERLDTLRLRDSIQSGKSKDFAEKTKSPEQMAEAAWMALRNLNSGKVNALDSQSTRGYILEASKCPMAQAYPMLALVIENEVKQHKGTSQAAIYIKPLFRACTIAAELTYKVAAKMNSTAEASILDIARNAKDGKSLIRAGQREKALEIIRNWVRTQAAEYITICDPYFGPEDLELVHLIRGENANLPLCILTSRKHQKDEDVKTPWDEAYQGYWRIHISEADPGDVRIVVVGSKDTGAIPIHDRWMVSKNSGIRLGSSVNFIGISKATEVTEIDSEKLPSIESLIRSYLIDNPKAETGERLSTTSFNLG